MRYLITIMALLTMLFAATIHATNQVPFKNQISSTIANYNRATPQIATSGVINKGGVQILAAHGFKTIIDLRTASEGVKDEKRAVELADMHYINIPVTNAGINDDQLAAFTEAIESVETPVLIHCASGNRVGALWATYRISKGIAQKIALEEGRTAGMRAGMEQKVRDNL